MNHANASRLACLLVLATVVPLGFAAKFYEVSGAAWVSDHAAGFFYVLFWTFLFLAIAPGSSPVRVTLWVFGVTCALEVLQLWHPSFLESIRDTPAGRAVIGHIFTALDLAFYGLAAVTAPVLARLVRRNRPRRS